MPFSQLKKKTNKKRWETKKDLLFEEIQYNNYYCKDNILKIPNWSTKGSFCKKVVFILEDHKVKLWVTYGDYVIKNCIQLWSSTYQQCEQWKTNSMLILMNTEPQSHYLNTILGKLFSGNKKKLQNNQWVLHGPHLSCNLERRAIINWLCCCCCSLLSLKNTTVAPADPLFFFTWLSWMSCPFLFWVSPGLSIDFACISSVTSRSSFFFIFCSWFSLCCGCDWSSLLMRSSRAASLSYLSQFQVLSLCLLSFFLACLPAGCSSPWQLFGPDLPWIVLPWRWQVVQQCFSKLGPFELNSCSGRDYGSKFLDIQWYHASLSKTVVKWKRNDRKSSLSH